MSRSILLRPTDPPTALPPTTEALRSPDGLLAVGGALTPEWLLHAYRRGVFPWYSPGQPILWWTPDPRTVLLPGEFHRSRSLRKSIRNRGYDTRIDTAFTAVVEGCAAPRSGEGGTWITPAMRAAYEALHRLGYAHSIETWHAERLVGGLYGVGLGRVFFGESMFSSETDASKVALARLVDESLARGIVLIDCQMDTAHLASLGARPIPRAQFEHVLAAAADPAVNVWSGTPAPGDAGGGPG